MENDKGISSSVKADRLARKPMIRNCIEGNQDVQHYTEDKGGKAMARGRSKKNSGVRRQESE